MVRISVDVFVNGLPSLQTEPYLRSRLWRTVSSLQETGIQMAFISIPVK